MSAKQSISAFTVIVAFLSVALMGLALVLLLPVKFASSHTLLGLTVYFSMPNNSARVIEMTATSKLEAMLARIKGVKNIYYQSTAKSLAPTGMRHTDDKVLGGAVSADYVGGDVIEYNICTCFYQEYIAMAA